MDIKKLTEEINTILSLLGDGKEITLESFKEFMRRNFNKK